MKEYEHLRVLFLKHLTTYRAQLLRRQPAQLYEPCDYILSLGGKRLRPLLALVACNLFGKTPRRALASALAVELFHNFSLVHDDILDKAPLRRNNPTVHVKWNHNIAILSGDALLVEAGKTLQKYDALQFKQLSVLFNQTATLVCEGQQIDMDFESAKNVTTKAYIEMIRLKTAVLLGCSLKMGAINAGAAVRDQRLLYAFGEKLGIAFQLLDDYLDVFAENPKEFGKQCGGDIIANKKTFLLIKSFELASPAQRKQITTLLKWDAVQNKKKVSGFIRLYNELGVGRLCIAEANRYTRLALASLNKVNAPPAGKTALKDFALELTRRQF